MPELPEVEAARRAIHDNCVGKKIKKSTIADDPKVIDSVSPSEFESALNGRTIVAAHRKGKNLWLQLDSPPFPSFQFGMAGAVYIKGVAVTQYKRSAVSSDEEWPSKYSKVFIELEDGLELSFTDKRRFARVRLLQDPTSVPPISELGPDALLEPMKIDEFMNTLRKKKISIKALLLDQSFISGIGNWIADEVLYQICGRDFVTSPPAEKLSQLAAEARIHPLQNAESLSKESCESLHRCIKEVIEKAVEVGADSSQYPCNWIFHSREKKSGEAFVDGKKINFITAGGRTSAYVPELQRLNGAKAEKKARQSKATKKDSDEEEAPVTEEEEHNGDSKSKKSNKATGGTKKRQKKASQGDGDISDEEEETQKPAKKGAARKQATKGSSKKRAISSQSSAKQKKTRK